MASSLLQWESDPLFSAAEVVQDSADRLVFFGVNFVFCLGLWMSVYWFSTAKEFALGMVFKVNPIRKRKTERLSLYCKIAKIAFSGIGFWVW